MAPLNPASHRPTGLLCRKTGVSGLAAEGKERYTEYNKDKADGKVDWGKEAKDASKDWRGGVSLPLLLQRAPSPG